MYMYSISYQVRVNSQPIKGHTLIATENKIVTPSQYEKKIVAPLVNAIEKDHYSKARRDGYDVYDINTFIPLSINYLGHEGEQNIEPFDCPTSDCDYIGYVDRCISVFEFKCPKCEVEHSILMKE